MASVLRISHVKYVVYSEGLGGEEDGEGSKEKEKDAGWQEAGCTE